MIGYAMVRLRAVGLVLAAGLAAQATAQTTVQLPGGYAPGGSIGYGAAGATWTPVTPATPLPTAAKQEGYMLVAANVASAPVEVYGGTYVFSQACGSYGSVALRVRGADGATMQPLLTRTATDNGAGTLLSLGSRTVVDAAVTGTDGCNVQLARVPS